MKGLQETTKRREYRRPHNIIPTIWSGAKDSAPETLNIAIKDMAMEQRGCVWNLQVIYNYYLYNNPI